MADLDALKRQAARKAIEFVRDGMVVGLGTGSTARHVVAGLGERVKSGLRIQGVPTSAETARLAQEAGILLLDAEGSWAIDVAIDGADQVDPQLHLIKGGGGALLKEKIVAAASRTFIVVVDASKRVPALGGTFPLPVEIVRFGWQSTARAIEALGYKPVLRARDGRPFVTEAGHYIVDLHIDCIGDPRAVEAALTLLPGVVETGLFVGRTDVLIVGTPAGVVVEERAR
jgi:ribose 5-phosphate isomerase A